MVKYLNQNYELEILIEELTINNYYQQLDLILSNYQHLKDNEKFSKISKRKEWGIYYTNFKIAYQITEETLKFNNKDFNKIKFFEPCAGLGIFVITYLEYIYNHSIKNINIEDIIKNIYIADIDNEAIIIAKKLIKKFVSIKWNLEINLLDENIFIGNVINSNNYKIHSTETLFNNHIKFDLILTNPPYKNLKASSKELNSEEIEDYKENCKQLAKEIRNKLNYQQGTLNLYKIFLELIYTVYSDENACIGVIIPSSILTDYTSSLLRKYLFTNALINNIFTLKENSKEFNDISQSLCYFGSIKKKNIYNILTLIEENKTKYIIDLSKIENIDENLPIIKLNNTSLNILNKLHKFEKIKQNKNIINLRGELDLTLNKKYITHEKTKYNLLQGKNIAEWTFSDNSSYVKESFVVEEISKKIIFSKKERIICHQISNISNKKRLKFSKIPSNYILGNSCNFISVKNFDIDYLLGILNSYLMDWHFRLFSSNNHINNYEIDNLPIAINNQIEPLIKECVEAILKGNKQEIIKLNKLIFKLYELNKNEIIEVLANYDDEYVIQLKKEYFE
ncbi:TaqI-like C-terminal specificity domain-containing protein [Aliarcobacter cryaerophilus]|uniref:TaqI-like C-terminal specificity domain-containing protein n=1 Tax=Aliarcobacter cryaerophilus TaxID=28198 RepID=UPI0021B691FB|nr:TaqI-like C-terminal specificity domain-containing protein [Aliarcobacter cryaerophilus]MCT7517108.1 Eco57I restriction-modification methylase domain-containing protein [Aliarcobacter cryaerophilus]